MIYTVTLNPALDHTVTVVKLTPNQVLRADKSQLDVGGKGFNVSRALKLMGVESTAIGYLGGHVGNLIQTRLKELGIKSHPIQTKEETRINIVVQDQSYSEFIKVNERGPSITADEIVVLFELIQKIAMKGDYWIFSGSLPKDAPIDLYGKLITLVNRLGCTAFLDSSGDALEHGLHASPFLIKPNREEAEYSTGLNCSSFQGLKKASEFFLNQRVKWVAISCGEDGLLLAHLSQTIFVPSPKIHAKNTVGAGDAVLAGLLWARINQLDLIDTAIWGVATGSVAASLEGVNFGNLKQISKMYEIIKENIKIG